MPAQIVNASPQSIPGSAAGEPELECIRVAGELVAILKEEARVLKQFDSAELLRLIPIKEFSAFELSRKLDALKEAQGPDFSVSKPLRDIIETIGALNSSNRHFIQSSLSHWQDLLDLLQPAAYGPRAETENTTHAPKGLAFSREV